MIRNQRGLGLLHILISMGVLLGVLFWILKMRTVSKPIAPAPGTDPSVQIIQSQLEEAAAVQDRKMGCAIAEDDCAPSPAPSRL